MYSSQLAIALHLSRTPPPERIEIEEEKGKKREKFRSGGEESERSGRRYARENQVETFKQCRGRKRRGGAHVKWIVKDA